MNSQDTYKQQPAPPIEDAYQREQDRRAAQENAVEFDEDGHAYRVNGVDVPSVTQILEDVGICDYSNLPPATRDDALARGKAVHDAMQFHLEGDLDMESVPEQWRGYVEAGMKFCGDVNLEPLNLEMKGYEPRLRYCGRLDAEGIMDIPRVGRRPCLIDWKTGTAQPWTRLQTAAYAKFFENPATRYRVCCELHKDKTYRIYVMPPQSFMDDWKRWEAAVTVYYTKREARW